MAVTKVYVSLMNFGHHLSGKLKCQKGMGTVEMILLIMILIGLATLFKGTLKTFYDGLVSSLNGSNAAQGVKMN